MLEVQQFVVGERYTNDQIRFSLNLENLGGIRPSIGKAGQIRHIVVMTALPTARKRKQENPYEDRIENDVLLYTATGKGGDQDLGGKNKRLLAQYEIPFPIFGFANEGRQIYRFIGLLEWMRHYQEQQLDRTGTFRNVWIFEFAIHKIPAAIAIEKATEIAANLITESRRLHPMTPDDKTVVVGTEAKPMPVPEQIKFVEAEQVRASLLTVEPYTFEHLLKDLVEKRGFRDVTVTKLAGDGGIDLSAYVPDMDDFFSGTLVQFQAKRWRHAVGSVEVNGFRGAISVSAKGVFVTTSHFTKAAIADARNAEKLSITLIDGQRLSRMILAAQLDVNHYLK